MPTRNVGMEGWRRERRVSLIPAAGRGQGGGRPHSYNIFQMVEKGAAARSEIVASWDRCIRLYRLDPEHGGDQTVVTQAELRQAAEGIESYMRGAEREINSLARQMANLGFFISIANVEGIVVTHRGCLPGHGIVDAKLQDGMCWQERVQGTNAIGTGLHAGRPMIICRDEHFYESNTKMTCLAVPLFGPAGRLIGVLNTTTLDPRIGRDLICILQSLLVSAAQRMEALWFRESYSGALIITASEASRSAGSVPLLAADADLNVLGATYSARAHYGITTAALETGLHLDQIEPGFGMEPPSLYEAERSTLKRALVMAGQNVSLAAKHLGISRATMNRKMSAYGLLRSSRRNGQQPEGELSARA